MTNIENLNWHDGILEGITLALGAKIKVAKDLIVDVSIYPTHDAKTRNFLQLHFKDVVCVLINCDLNELEDNKNAGNISNGYVKENNSGVMVFRLYLVDGYIEIIYGSVILTTGP